MDCRYRAGFTYRLSRLKPRASEKMGGLIKNDGDLFFFLHRYSQWKTKHLRTEDDIPFFALHQTDIFSENRTSEDVKTFFCSSNQCDQIRPSKAYLRAGPLCHAPPLTLPFSKQEQY